MKVRLVFSRYLIVYILFLGLYTYNVRHDLNYDTLKLCSYSSVIPALVGGTVGNLFAWQNKSY